MFRLIFVLTISQIFSASASIEFCPENSLCSQKEAKLYKKLSAALKGNNKRFISLFIQQKGFPLQYLSPANPTDQPKGVSWSSRCAIHNIKNKKILKSEAFFKKLVETKSILFPKASVQNTSYLAPYDNAPYYIKKGKLIYQYDFFEKPLLIAISPKGVVSSFVKSAKNIPVPISIPCDQALKKASSELFSYSICQKIWNDDLKRFQKLRLDWGCP